MNQGVPWQIRGVPDQVRDAAREAARRANMSVGDWLNEAIYQSARAEGVDPRESVPPPARGPDDPLSAITARLDDLGRQLEHVARGLAPRARDTRPPDDGREAHHPYAAEWRSDPSPPERSYPTQAADPPDMVDRAIAEIAARQRELDQPPPALQRPPRREPASPPAAYAPPPSSYAPAGRPFSPSAAPPEQPPTRPDVLSRPATQDLSGLERQLRDITERIETLRRPDHLAESIEALRAELGQIGRAIQDALPRRAVEALEHEVRAVASKLNQSRGDGHDADALASLERGLLEVRDALHSLTPAENLGGLHQAMQSIAYKVDAIATGGHDPGTLHQLEEAVATLRDVVSHVASGDALGALVEEIRNLSVKVDRFAKTGNNDAILTAIDQRIAMLASAFEARHADPGADFAPRIEAAFNTISEQLERLPGQHTDPRAAMHLEDRIAHLVEMLDASGTRLNHLESIDRSLTDLIAYLEHQQMQGTQTPGHAPEEPSRHVGEIERHLAELRAAGQQNQESLEAAHGALDHVVNRLAMIENDLHPASSSVAPQLREPFAAGEPAPPRAAPLDRSERRPIDPTLPPDHPLEPGLGAAAAGRRAAEAAERIAASEAALGSGKPPVIPDPGGKSDFIAAARRAARAASVTAGADAAARIGAPAGEPPELVEPGAQATEEQGGKLTQRVRSLFVGAGVVFVVLGALHVTSRMLSPQAEPTNIAALTQRPSAKPADNAAAGDVTGSISETAPLAAPALAPAPSVSSPPGAPSFPVPDFTNSLYPPAARPETVSTTTPLPPLPADFGSEALRNAAGAGDPAAAFEVATRYAGGRGAPQNIDLAIRWFDRASEQGLAPAQFRLAGLYEKGTGVKRNLTEARRLYLAAANAGHGKAMHNLAVLYAEGVDGKPDYKIAAEWFARAAAHGILDSQFNLAILYARGLGVERNLSEAYKWFALAAAGGDKDAAGKRDDVAAHMDRQALVAARLAVQTFVPQPQPDEAVNVREPRGGWDVPETISGKRASRTSGPARSARTADRPPR